MSIRHIMTGAMLCLLFIFSNCDTMDDVNKMEKETNNMTLISVPGLGFASTVCHDGALMLSLNGNRNITTDPGGGQTNYFYINITTAGKNLSVSTSGDAGLSGSLENPSCTEIYSSGSWTGDITMITPISAAGKYWIYVQTGYTKPGTNYTIYTAYY
ncbi:MAG: hypothetical protein KA369_06615 [Spirochaetes bacterium]|nr:hypothetical protein [Spirochaetota bacterium]